MAKRRVKRGRVARKKSPSATSRAASSRYEYNRLSLELARVESMVTRNRTDLDIQFRRIAQLQDEVDQLKKTLAAPNTLTH